jgi:hypothetical protein
MDRLRQVHAIAIELPRILLADRNEMGTALFCRPEGARFLFSKPIVGPELLAAVALITGCPKVVQRIGFSDAAGRAMGQLIRLSRITLIARLLGAGSRKRSKLGTPLSYNFDESNSPKKMSVVAGPTSEVSTVSSSALTIL